MSEFSAVANDDGQAGARANGAYGADGADGTPEADGTPDVDGVDRQPDPDPDRGPVPAVLRGGPAAGKQVLVPRIAGTFPLFIGVDGGNYVRDKGTHDRPVYNWWPAGASSPAGEPGARSDSR